MRAKKSYGQHFLTNEVYAERIANSLERTAAYDTLLEVGPGKGMLTKYLLQRPETLYASEADADMIEYLHLHYPELSERILRGNFLRLDFREHFGDRPFAIIGNFPYNISSQIVFKMLENREQVPELVGMFQREMAERIIAPPGGKDYGVISVLTQAYYSGTYLFTVKAGNFDPPPKVQSAVIRLERKENTRLNCSEKFFRTVVKTSFGQRRKMLRNTLKSLIPDKELLNHPIFTQRPERLSVEAFAELTRMIENARSQRSPTND